MLQPTDRRHSFAPQPSTAGPVTCATCGCRLRAVDEAGSATWQHFGSLGGRDARGCRVACVDAVHDAHGLPIRSAVA